MEIYKRLKELKRMTSIPLQHRKICIEVIENHHSTAELHRLAEVDKNFQWLKSTKSGKILSTRQIHNILNDYFPEFHLKTTNKKNNKEQALRTEQQHVKREVNEGICYRCGATKNLEIHHMIPLAIGGTNDKGNVIILCKNCHRIATDYFMKIYKRSDVNNG